MREVPADVKEAADGMGMSGAQQFWRVELPLALPLVMSGVRLALVQVWATATIAALVAGPGVGRIIVDGFARNHLQPGHRGRGRGGASRRWSWSWSRPTAQRAVDPVPQGVRSGPRGDAMSAAGSYAVADAGGVSRRTGHARDAAAGHRR